MSGRASDSSFSRTLEQVQEGRQYSPDSFETAREAIALPGWLPGWYPVHTFVGAVILGLFAWQGYDVGFSVVWKFVIVGAVVYGLSVLYINRTARPIMDAFERDARTNAQEILALDGDIATYTLRYRNGSVPLVKPPKELAPTSLVLGESSVAIHSDAELDMAWLDPHIGDNTSEIFYDQIASVDYDEPNLKIQVTTGNTYQFPSSRNPDDVLHDLQQRVRQHKR